MSQLNYAPDRGDVVWIDMDPQIGREHAGRRPALVLSPASYNRQTGLAVVCPVTSKVKGYTFEVPLPAGLAVTGVVLADQAKSLDWQARRAVYIDTVSEAMVRLVVDRLKSLIGP